MIKVNLLEARMKEQQIKYNDLAEVLNMSYQSLNKRVKGKVEFRLNEIAIIKKTLKLSLEQTNDIFLNDN